MRQGVVSTANIVADYILSKVNCTHKKLQKLLYFSYQWYLYVNNDTVDCLENKLFAEPFEAWVHGPVIRDIYYRFARYRGADIVNMHVNRKLDKEVSNCIDNVLEVYGDYSANELELLSHMESSWKNKRIGLDKYEICSEELDDRDIYTDCEKRDE